MSKLNPPSSLIRNARGQTSVEYMLMLVVIVAIMFSLLGMVRNFLLSESGECTPTDQAWVCQFQQKVFNTSAGFKYFGLIGGK